jgi:hypothetical protein
LNNEFLYEAGDEATDHEGNESAPWRHFILSEIIDHHDGRDGQQVQKVNANGEPIVKKMSTIHLSAPGSSAWCSHLSIIQNAMAVKKDDMVYFTFN